jgi:glycosyltransferase involved in cell wall biosynthesis
MKISIIGPGIMPIPPTGWGAVEILIWDYYQELTKLGHEVQIVNTPNQNQIIQEVNNFDPDFVHLQYDNFVQVLDHIKCKNKAATTHFGYLEQPNKHYGYRSLFNAFVNSNFRIFCLSEGIKKTYLDAGCSLDRLEVTPNGARYDLFKYNEVPQFSDRSIYLAKITDRKKQYLYQDISNLYFAGNLDDHRFNSKRNNYLGEWDKQTLYNNLTDYSNLVLLSDGEADPLVTKEAMMAGLGLVLSEYSVANLNLTKPFIDVIPNERLNDVDYVSKVIEKNKSVSIKHRKEIREYAINNFSWDKIIKTYIEKIEKNN